ncbi:MAG: hypothetical protein Q7J27_12545, partial [Syntrophales bacterium]|nr:hypothetical protein [Syntrophales bacterium]
TKIFYVALFPGDDNVIFNETYLKSLSNQLETIVPDARNYGEVVKVYDTEKENMHIVADVVSQ